MEEFNTRMKEAEKIIGHKWITDDQVVEAMDYVRAYIKMNGGNPYGIEWFKPKPKFLPEDVAKAWDTVVQRADDEQKLGISV